LIFVVDLDHVFACEFRAWRERHIETIVVESKRGTSDCGLDDCCVLIDDRRASAHPSGVRDGAVVEDSERSIEEPDYDKDEDWEDECELDQALAAVLVGRRKHQFVLTNPWMSQFTSAGNCGS
jgi:hypothetical protein